MGKKDKFLPCPYCGGMIKADAESCTHCGSDENTGWSDNTYMDGISLYDDEDYGEMVQKEFGKNVQGTNKKVSVKTIIGAVLLLAIIFLFLKGIFLW